MSAIIGRREMCLKMFGFGVASAIFKLNAAPSVRPFCSYSLRHGWTGYDDGALQYVTHEARPNDPSGVPQVVDKIREVLAITPTFDIYIAKHEDNAFATISGGRKILVIDVDFLENLNRQIGTQWGAIQVIAHEVGHHIAGFVPDKHRGELNADYWSGQALRRLNASEEAAQRAILTVGSERDSATHPNKYRRAEVIARGWEDAARGRIDYSFCEGCR